MDSIRRTSIVTGALLITATIAVLAAGSLAPALTGSDYLTGVADHPHRLAAAALLYLIAAGTSVGIAIALYPLLKGISTALALGSVVFRTIEAVFYIAAVVSLLTIGSLSQAIAAGPAESRAPSQPMADALVSLRDHSNMAAIFAFSVGALMYYSLFYRSRLGPRWLSGWGIGAICLILTACLLALVKNRPVTGFTLRILPIAIQEMVLAVWLLVKGFRPSATGFAAPSHGRQRRTSAAASPLQPGRLG